MEVESPIKQTSHWTILLIIFLVTVAFGFVFQGLPPILTFMISSLGLTHAQAGALMGIFSLPGVIIAIPGSIFATAYGAKRVILSALITMSAGVLLVALAPAFPLLVIGRLIAGIGGMTIVVAAPQTLAVWFSDKRLSIAISVYNSALPVSVLMTFNTFGTLAKTTRWQMPVWMTFAFCAVVCLLFAWKYPAKSSVEIERHKPDLRENLIILKKAGSPVWLLFIVWMLYNISSISFMTFAGDYFIAQGLSVELAGFLTSLFMMSSIVLGPLLGALISRIGKEIHFIVFGCAVLGFFLLLVPRSDINPLILVGMISLSSVFIPTPLLTLVPRCLPSRYSGLGYGLSSMLANLGSLIGPYFVGLIHDHYGDHSRGFDFMAIFAILGMVIALLIPRAVKKNESRLLHLIE
ncbi:MAG: MFS transporter [Clostridia bacterium]|nr:MFS transporter [Clostridia bacterium]MBP6161490.1 MFS transporter [Clostridia bacterium]MBP6949791.1 MFS transporter [Clostridia bacterium]